MWTVLEFKRASSWSLRDGLCFEDCGLGMGSAALPHLALLPARDFWMRSSLFLPFPSHHRVLCNSSSQRLVSFYLHLNVPSIADSTSRTLGELLRRGAYDKSSSLFSISVTHLSLVSFIYDCDSHSSSKCLRPKSVSLQILNRTTVKKECYPYHQEQKLHLYSCSWNKFLIMSAAV